jgi:hypothetical protein
MPGTVLTGVESPRSREFASLGVKWVSNRECQVFEILQTASDIVRILHDAMFQGRK